jgi:hypothetical protein
LKDLTTFAEFITEWIIPFLFMAHKGLPRYPHHIFSWWRGISNQIFERAENDNVSKSKLQARLKTHGKSQRPIALPKMTMFQRVKFILLHTGTFMNCKHICIENI